MSLQITLYALFTGLLLGFAIHCMIRIEHAGAPGILSGSIGAGIFVIPHYLVTTYML